jgi:catechol 2,3-dioxygenase-like lactoylglutathione lyase family enzyme
MTTVHVGLVCSSEENADYFYRDLLGLKKAEPRMLPQTLSSAIFNIDAELKIINYTGNGSHFEIFIRRQAEIKDSPVEHVCIEVEDLAGFLKRGRAMNMKILQVPKGDSFISFISDPDGNLFELKEKKS